jgi:hypothetical protein
VASVLSAFVGAGIVETAHLVRDRRGRDMFAQRLQCKRLAEQYLEKNSSEYHNVMLERVEFSVPRNSCVASIAEISSTPPADTWTYQVTDVISNENLYMDLCIESSASGLIYCSHDRVGELMRKRDKAFKDSL